AEAGRVDPAVLALVADDRAPRSLEPGRLRRRRALGRARDGIDDERGVGGLGVEEARRELAVLLLAGLEPGDRAPDRVASGIAGLLDRRRGSRRDAVVRALREVEERR